MFKCNLFKNIKGKPKTVLETWSMSDFKVNQCCVESLSCSDGWMAGHVQSNNGTQRGQGWSVLNK
ncbi:hypothetical protein YC2023_076384 [Brassica napus]